MATQQHRHKALYAEFYARRAVHQRMPFDRFSRVVGALESGAGNFRKIANDTGAGRDSVARIANLTGIANSDPKARRIQEAKLRTQPISVRESLRKLREKGLSINKAAEILGVSPKTAMQMERRMYGREKRKQLTGKIYLTMNTHPKRPIIIQMLRTINQDKEHYGTFRYSFQIIAKACGVSVHAVRTANKSANVRNATDIREVKLRYTRMPNGDAQELLMEATEKALRLIKEMEAKEEQKARKVSQYQRIIIERNLAELIESRRIGTLNGWKEEEAKKLMKRVISALTQTPIMRCGIQELSSKTRLNQIDVTRLILGMSGMYVRRDGDIVSIETKAIQRWK